MKERPFCIGSAPRLPGEASHADDDRIATSVPDAAGPYTPVTRIARDFARGLRFSSPVLERIHRTLRRILPARERIISSGQYGTVYRTDYVCEDNGAVVTLARKAPRAEGGIDIAHALHVYAVLREIGVPTPELFTDGRNLYTEYLNVGSVIALSANNPVPAVADGRGVAPYMLEHGKIAVRDLHDFFAHVTNDIFVPLARNRAVCIPPGDAYFFLANTANTRCTPGSGAYEVSLRATIGDLDCVKILPSSEIHDVPLIIEAFHIGWRYFVDRYMDNLYGHRAMEVFRNRFILANDVRDIAVTQRGKIAFSNVCDDDVIFALAPPSHDVSRQRFCDLVNRLYATQFSPEEIALTPQEISRHTRYCRAMITDDTLACIARAGDGALVLDGDIHATARAHDAAFVRALRAVHGTVRVRSASEDKKSILQAIRRASMRGRHVII